MNVKNIVEQHLKNMGFDGLYTPEECGCEVGDLMPCDSERAFECLPGYKGPCVDCSEEHDFHIGPEKTVK